MPCAFFRRTARRSAASSRICRRSSCGLIKEWSKRRFPGERWAPPPRKFPFSPDWKRTKPIAKCRALLPEHDPEKWTPVFGKDHAPTDNLTIGKAAMALIRIEPVKDESLDLYYVAIYHPADAEQPFVTTQARYKTAAAAENDAIAIIASGANKPRSSGD